MINKLDNLIPYNKVVKVQPKNQDFIQEKCLQDMIVDLAEKNYGFIEGDE